MKPIDNATIERLAEAASVDKRTILRRLISLPVRGLAGMRADRAIAEHRKIAPGANIPVDNAPRGSSTGSSSKSRRA